MTDLKLLATQALADRAEHTSQSGTVWRDEHYERAVFEREPALARGYLELEAEASAACDAIFYAVPKAEISDGVSHTVATKIDALVRLLGLVIAERDASRAETRAEVAQAQVDHMLLMQERDAARAEVKRLTGCLKRANAGTEHFEQSWNLAMDERDEARAEVARLRRYEQCIVCDKPLVNDDCVEHCGAGVSARKQLRDLSQEALTWQRRESEAIAQRDAARAALTEACAQLEEAVERDALFSGLEFGSARQRIKHIAVLRTRGGVE